MTGRFSALLLCLALAACGGGGGGDGDPFRGRPSAFDGEVLRLAIPREDGGRERFSSLRDQGYSWTWAPFLPDRSGRRWTLYKADRDGLSLAYALVSWDNDDPTDYLAAGYWLRFEGVRSTRDLPLAEAATVPFIDGPELAARLHLPPGGTASYAGEAGGIYAYRYGAGWPETPDTVEEFAGTMTLEADFDAMTVSACIGCEGDLAIQRQHLYAALGWRRGRPPAQPTDYEIRYAPVPIRPDGSFAGAAAAVSHPARRVAASGGEWSGRLSARPAGDGAPRLAAGLADARFAEADGSAGSFRALFTVLHPELQPPPQPPPPGRRP